MTNNSHQCCDVACRLRSTAHFLHASVGLCCAPPGVAASPKNKTAASFVTRSVATPSWKLNHFNNLDAFVISPTTDSSFFWKLVTARFN